MSMSLMSCGFAGRHNSFMSAPSSPSSMEALPSASKISNISLTCGQQQVPVSFPHMQSDQDISQCERGRDLLAL